MLKLVFGDNLGILGKLAAIPALFHDNNNSSTTSAMAKSGRTPLPSGRRDRQDPNNVEENQEPNYWQPLMEEYAKELEYLPVPPKDLVRRESKAKRTTNLKVYSHYKIGLKHLKRRDERHRTLPSQKPKQCMRWILEPMREKAPEPMPGVPRITVTDPKGKTWWPRDPNSYITTAQVVDISVRMMKEHKGPDSEAHCAAFQEAYLKGLDHKPKGMKPEILYCCDCWTRQAEIEMEMEMEEARVGVEVVHLEGQREYVEGAC